MCIRDSNQAFPTSSIPTPPAPEGPRADHDNKTAPTSSIPSPDASEAVGRRLEDVELADLWRPPPGGYCYRHGNDWSECAGDHLLYPARSEQQLYESEYMCLYEPYCWKQLDWRRKDPPPFQCAIDRSLRLYEFSFHDGCMADQSSFIERRLNPLSNASHQVYLCNCKHADPANKQHHTHSFKRCPRERNLECDRAPPSDQRSRDNFNAYHDDPHFAGADALMFGFGPSMWEHWMAFNKTVIAWPAHRSNMGRCTAEQSASTFENIRRLAKSGATGKFPAGPTHIIGPGHLHEVEFLRHYTGIRPIYLPVSLFGVLQGITWSGSRREIIWNGDQSLIMRDPELGKENLAATPARGLPFNFVDAKHEGWYETPKLATYTAVVYMPYSISNYKIVEQYTMNIPIFTPTPEFAARDKSLYNDRTSTYEPYCPTLTPDMLKPHSNSPYEFSPDVRANRNGPSALEAEAFWIGFGEVYHWPCVLQFGSWRELMQLLRSTNFTLSLIHISEPTRPY
eukprot:TRINITY_DN39436_c0_g1_i2.p1 TRINITY_DN39436_c0_g1~~TRINITY_DN39436_c0_g1_i2.p1  ORF type:complete len:510 (+),score=46.32 TRINITY_DN39436_c0_g1_i2:53-1582(+)